MTSIEYTVQKLPKSIIRDLGKIKSILLRHGAKKIILYGSFARGDFRLDSDIDICVEGIPDKNYFRALSECLMNIERPVSLIDYKSAYGYLLERINSEGRILMEIASENFRFKKYHPTDERCQQIIY